MLDLYFDYERSNNAFIGDIITFFLTLKCIDKIGETAERSEKELQNLIDVFTYFLLMSL